MTRSVGYAVQVQPAEDAIGGPRTPADPAPTGGAAAAGGRGPHGSESRISEAPSPDDTAASINS